MPARLEPDPSLTEAEWAWCAGLFEGEGSISATSEFGVEVRIGMTDRDVLERLEGLWPSPNGVFRSRPPRPGYRAQWTWRVGERDRVLGFLSGIYEWLGERRRQRADEALLKLEKNRGRWNRTHCKRGHPFAGDNLYIYPSGKRACRRCNREWRRKSRRGTAAA